MQVTIDNTAPPPALGAKYWTYYKSPTGFIQVLQATWRGDRTDLKRYRENRIMPDQPSAARAAAEKSIFQVH